MAAIADTQTLRWGIIGTGWIASAFTSDILLDPSTHRNEHSVRHVIQAVGSSSLTKASAFWSKVGAGAPSPSLYESYLQVYNDPDVDIVYIATPHSLHVINALDAINAGKHVLCEKPLTISAKEAEKLILAARNKGVFFMEAVWTRFFPLVLELQRLLHIEKAIGRVTRAFIDFGLNMPLDTQPEGSRLTDVLLGGGALLDIGIYPLTWASVIFPTSENGEPEVASSLSLNKGVDESASVLLRYKNGAQAVCTSTYLHKTGEEFGRIEGTGGSIILSGRSAPRPSALVLKRKSESDTVLDFTFEGDGFFYEADAVAKDIRAGKVENEVMPLSETLRMMRLMDRIRQQNGLIYPQDA